MIADTGPTFALRKITDRIGTGAAIFAVAIAIVPLVSVVVFVLQLGGPVISWSFITTNPPPTQSGMHGGIWASTLGSLEIVGLTSLMGIPVGILSGIFLATSRDNWFTRSVRFGTDIVAGLPSILAGILVASLIVSELNSPSGFAASVALALLMFPTVTRATEAAITAVPTELREAALGLGATDWITALRILIPTAASGIVTAVILGVARVAGETAPLVLTLGMLGYNLVNTDIFHGFMAALPGQIYNDSQSPFPSDRQAALAGAFALFVLVMFLNLLARAVTFRLTRRTRVV